MARLTCSLLIFFCFIASAQAGTTLKSPANSASILKSMQWRELGPFRGGRADAVAGIAEQPNVYYFGATGGGVWKTNDGGQSWKAVSDGFFGGSIGAIAVAPSDPNIVYVGTGEKTVRGNVSPGAGMWKSADAGKTWTHIGLDDSQQIARVRVHPVNAELVYVAAMGHAFGPNDMRGVYRSRDGGKTWERTLFVNRDAGAVDLVMDPSNPRILYAATWRYRRGAYFFESGGEGSGLWKSTDGGDSWKELSSNKGMPKGTLGIIGVSVSPSNPQNVYAIVEAKEGGVFRSRDGGDTWAKTSELADLRQRAWYFSRIYADPKDEDVAYLVNVRFHKTKDGGKTWRTISTPHGDNHDLWVAPNDPNRMIEANDGGVNVTIDGGATWTKQDNQPTAQIYRVSVDTDFPYRLLGAQQDNSAVRIRHRGAGSGISPRDWDVTAGGESGHIVADPTNPDVVFGGSYGGYLTYINHRTNEVRDVSPWPDNPMGSGAADNKHRFQWNYPLFFSPRNPAKLYAASQYLMESVNAGASWRIISPDLTRNDKSKGGVSGGPITKDNTSIEYYSTIFAAAESPAETGVLWTGSDDGLVQVSKDGGALWENVTPPKSIMPEWIMINSIELPAREKGVAYIAATNFKWDDFRPYLYKTADYGKTWSKIVDGIPASEFTRVIRADPERRGMLYAGTERGVYFSRDDGNHWQPLQFKLPVVPIHDMRVHDDALIVATHGRGFWMLDNLAPLRQLTPEIASKAVHLFTPAPAWRLLDGQGRAGAGQGANPPGGAVIDYYVREQKVGTKVAMAILSNDGKVIREYTGTVQAEPDKPREARGSADVVPALAAAKPDDNADGEKPNGESIPDKEAAKAEDDAGDEEGGGGGRDTNKLKDVVNGHNRFVWNLRTEEVKRFPGMVLWNRALRGPYVVPGTYQARLTLDDQPAQTVSFELRADPRSKATSTDLKAQFDFVRAASDKLSEVHAQIIRIREVRKQLADVKKRAVADKSVAAAATELDRKMTAVEETLYQTKSKSSQDPLNYPIRLNDKLAGVSNSAATGADAPAAQQLAVRDELVSKIDAELAKLKAIWDNDLPAFNKLASAVVAVY